MLYSWMMLGVEANRVIGLRLTKLMRGGRAARREAKLMVTEKIDAALKTHGRILAGASSDDIVQAYRRRVAANAKRLSKSGPSGSVLKRKRRRRK